MASVATAVGQSRPDLYPLSVRADAGATTNLQSTFPLPVMQLTIGYLSEDPVAIHGFLSHLEDQGMKVYTFAKYVLEEVVPSETVPRMRKVKFVAQTMIYALKQSDLDLANKCGKSFEAVDSELQLINLQPLSFGDHNLEKTILMNALYRGLKYVDPIRGCEYCRMEAFGLFQRETLRFLVHCLDQPDFITSYLANWKIDDHYAEYFLLLAFACIAKDVTTLNLPKDKPFPKEVTNKDIKTIQKQIDELLALHPNKSLYERFEALILWFYTTFQNVGVFQGNPKEILASVFFNLHVDFFEMGLSLGLFPEQPKHIRCVVRIADFHQIRRIMSLDPVKRTLVSNKSLYTELVWDAAGREDCDIFNYILLLPIELETYVKERKGTQVPNFRFLRDLSNHDAEVPTFESILWNAVEMENYEVAFQLLTHPAMPNKEEFVSSHLQNHDIDRGIGWLIFKDAGPDLIRKFLERGKITTELASVLLDTEGYKNMSVKGFHSVLKHKLGWLTDELFARLCADKRFVHQGSTKFTLVPGRLWPEMVDKRHVPEDRFYEYNVTSVSRFNCLQNLGHLKEIPAFAILNFLDIAMKNNDEPFVRALIAAPQFAATMKHPDIGHVFYKQALTQEPEVMEVFLQTDYVMSMDLSVFGQGVVTLAAAGLLPQLQKFIAHPRFKNISPHYIANAITEANKLADKAQAATIEALLRSTLPA